jgi:hypothetical protein
MATGDLKKTETPNHLEGWMKVIQELYETDRDGELLG